MKIYFTHLTRPDRFLAFCSIAQASFFLPLMSNSMIILSRCCSRFSTPARSLLRFYRRILWAEYWCVTRSTETSNSGMKFAPLQSLYLFVARDWKISLDLWTAQCMEFYAISANWQAARFYILTCNDLAESRHFGIWQDNWQFKE